ncbi:hypothetical protein MTO96_009958 [Rhipicephalus appendiculatus]
MLTALPLVEAAAVRKVVGFMVMTIPRIAVQRGSLMLDEAIAVNQRVYPHKAQLRLVKRDALPESSECWPTLKEEGVDRVAVESWQITSPSGLKVRVARRMDCSGPGGVMWIEEGEREGSPIRPPPRARFGGKLKLIAPVRSRAARTRPPLIHHGPVNGILPSIQLADKSADGFSLDRRQRTPRVLATSGTGRSPQSPLSSTSRLRRPPHEHTRGAHRFREQSPHEKRVPPSGKAVEITSVTRPPKASSNNLWDDERPRSELNSNRRFK